MMWMRRDSPTWIFARWSGRVIFSRPNRIPRECDLLGDLSLKPSKSALFWRLDSFILGIMAFGSLVRHKLLGTIL